MPTCASVILFSYFSLQWEESINIAYSAKLRKTHLDISVKNRVCFVVVLVKEPSNLSKGNQNCKMNRRRTCPKAEQRKSKGHAINS